MADMQATRASGIATAIIALLAASCTAASSPSSTAGGGSIAQSDGCFAVSEAVSAFSDFSDGLDHNTLTEGDVEADLKKIADKLDDASSVGPAAIVPAATAGATDAGQIRVAVSNHDEPSSIAAQAADLRTQIDALVAACKD